MEVFERVFLGDRHVARDADFFAKNKIYHVLNITANLKNHFENVQVINTTQETPNTSPKEKDAYETFPFDTEDDENEVVNQDAKVPESPETLQTQALEVDKEVPLEGLIDELTLPYEKNEFDDVFGELEIADEVDKENINLFSNGGVENQNSNDLFSMDNSMYTNLDVGINGLEPTKTKEDTIISENNSPNVQKTTISQQSMQVGLTENSSKIPQLNRKKGRKTKKTPKKTVAFQLEKPIRYKRITIADSMDTNIRQYFDDCIEFIVDSLKNEGEACLVHCQEAKSRSVTIVIAYAMKELKWSLKKAYEHVHTLKCGSIRVNDGFKRQLMEYERDLYSENSIDFFPKRKRVENYCDLDHYGDFDDDNYIEVEDKKNRKRKRQNTSTPKAKKQKITSLSIVFKASKSNTTFAPLPVNTSELYNALNRKKKQITLFDMFAKAQGQQTAKQPTKKNILPKVGTKQMTINSYFTVAKKM